MMQMRRTCEIGPTKLQDIDGILVIFCSTSGSSGGQRDRLGQLVY